ncbi:MAG: hypothetical protein HYZ53_08265 [Planctomycetes bacterium]|nr:hypothetical protein [Planctomycetota bacterium]
MIPIARGSCSLAGILVLAALGANESVRTRPSALPSAQFFEAAYADVSSDVGWTAQGEADAQIVIELRLLFPSRGCAESISTQWREFGEFLVRGASSRKGASLLMDDGQATRLLRALRRDERSREFMLPRELVADRQPATAFGPAPRMMRPHSEWRDLDLGSHAIRRPVLAPPRDEVEIRIVPALSVDRKYVSLEISTDYRQWRKQARLPAATCAGGAAHSEGNDALELVPVPRYLRGWVAGGASVTVPDEGWVLLGDLGKLYPSQGYTALTEADPAKGEVAGDFRACLVLIQAHVLTRP